MTTLGEAMKVIREMEDFTRKIIDEKCSGCPEFKTDSNPECFCEDVLKMIDDHDKQPGYDNCVANCWDKKRAAYLRYHGMN